MAAFGTLLRTYRLQAGLGLRTFAGLIDQRASTVSAIESHRRAPWRHEALLHRVAKVLGMAESSEAWGELTELAKNGPDSQGSAPSGSKPGTLQWWWATEDAAPLEHDTIAELAEFLGVTTESAAEEVAAEIQLPALTELAIEWRVRRLLGRRNLQFAAGPVDVESILENQTNDRLEIVAGLVPRFSVQACAVKTDDVRTLFIDRIIADSRPLASYRHLLAQCYAPAALWDDQGRIFLGGGWFERLRTSDSWSEALRSSERFALAMLLPADPVLAGSEDAYRELVEQQGWVDAEVGARAVRNRLAEQFAVPPALVHRRLVGWPCHLYGRIAQALAAQELTLPPTDWLVDDDIPQQRMLFDLNVRQPI